jgi:hypothetical protein
MDGVDLILKDHRKVFKLIDKINAEDDDMERKQDLVDKLFLEVRIHDMLERKVRLLKDSCTHTLNSADIVPIGKQILGKRQKTGKGIN